MTDAVAETGHDAVRERDRRHSVLAYLCVVLGALVLSAAAIVPSIHSYHAVSNTDETSYLDYIYRVGHGQYVIGKGQTISLYTANQLDCRGIAKTDIKPNIKYCQSPTSPLTQMRNTASIDPPTYYVLTSLAARLIMRLDVTDDLLVAARLTGCLWCAASLSLLFFCFRRFGADLVASAIACFVLFSNPLVFQQWTHVTPHASDVLVGLGVTWAVMRWSRDTRRWWLLGAAGLIPPLVKATDVLAPVMMGLFLLLAALSRSEPLFRQWAKTAAGIGLLIAGLLVGTVVTVAVRDHYALTVGNEFPQFNVTALRPGFLISQTGTFLLAPGASGWVGLGRVSTALMVGCVLRYAFSARTSSEPDGTVAESAAALPSLATSVFAALVFGAWIFVLSNYLILRQFVVIPTRYGLSVMPAAVLLVATTMRSWPLRIAFAIVSAALLPVAMFPNLQT